MIKYIFVNDTREKKFHTFSEIYFSLLLYGNNVNWAEFTALKLKICIKFEFRIPVKQHYNVIQQNIVIN